MTRSYNSIHSCFKLNGFSYSKEELREVAYSLVKEGKPFEISIGDFLLDWLSKKPTIEVKTSGSTGKPKIIVLKKEHMLNSALATGSYFALKAENKALLCLNTDFIAGKIMLVRAMALGLELDYVEPSSNLLDSSVKKYDFAAMVPLQVEASLEKLSQIKTLLVGGAPMSNSLKEKVKSLDIQVFETYGMTETITHIAVKKINSISIEAENYFNILPNIQITQDSRNCLVINAPNLSYKPVVTNDIIELISDTEFQLLGRYDNIINSGGIKLIPEEIESKLSSIIDNRFFVAGVPDEKLGKKLVLLVERDKNAHQLPHLIMKSGIFQKFEIPKQIFSIKNFIETESGKVNRKATVIKLLEESL